MSKDSWSRCEVPSSLYDATRNVNAISKPPKPVLHSVGKNRDTIEAIQQHLKKEMEGKLQNKGLILPHESFVAVIQVGKYMFLAVMLPVYLCFYGIPRWVAMNAIPQCFLFVKTQTLNVGRFVIEITKKVVNLMKGLMESMIGNALRISREHARNLWRSLSFKFSSVANRLANKVNKPFLHFKKIKEGVREHFTNLYRKARQQAEITSRKMHKKKSFFIGQAKKLFFQSLKAFDRSVFNPIMKIVRQAFEWLMNPVRNFIMEGIHLLKVTKTQLNKIFMPPAILLKNAIKRGVELCKRTLIKLAKPLGEVFQMIKTQVKKGLEKMKELYFDPLIQVGITRWRIVKPYVEKSFLFVRKKIFKFSFVYKKVFQAIEKILPRMKENLAKKKGFFSRSRRSMKSFVLSAASGCRRILLITSGLCKKLWEMLIKAAASLKQLLKRALLLSLKVQKKIHRYILSFFKGIAFVIARTSFAGYVVVLIFWYAGLHAFYLAREISSGNN